MAKKELLYVPNLSLKSYNPAKDNGLSS